MKGLSDLLLLGNPLLYQVADLVLHSELPLVKDWVDDMHNVMQETRVRYNFGRAIAAPQLGIMKRLIYMNIDRPVVFVNPDLTNLSNEMLEVWDDCMCFPNLLVRVRRHKTITMKYRDENWKARECMMENDLSELLQHEYDHLNGVLCTMRAIDDKSFKWRAN